VYSIRDEGVGLMKNFDRKSGYKDIGSERKEEKKEIDKTAKEKRKKTKKGNELGYI